MDLFRIGPRLRAAREAQRMTRRDLASILGKPEQWLMRRERGSTDPTAADIRAWAQATGADPRWLLDLGGTAPTMTVAEESGKREAVWDRL